MRDLHYTVRFDTADKGDTYNPLQSIHVSITTSAKDMAENKRDAWIYGIAVGWDDESYVELQKRFNWLDNEVERNKILHQKFIDCWLYIQDKK